MTPYIILISAIIAMAITIYLIRYRYLRREKKNENKLKREITQNISHELRTPLSSILGYIESIIENEDLPPEKVKYFLERTHQQAKRLQSLLDDISILNKLDEKKPVYEFENVIINNVINEVVEDVQTAMNEKGITYKVDIPEECNIIGNKSLIYSILRNLFDNSIAYAGEGINITIKLSKTENRFYHFEFSDNGIGIDKKHLPRIFERFYRVEKGRSRKSGGTGLGLSIVKNAIKLHNGKISVQNNSNTSGVTFYFSIRKS